MGEFHETIEAFEDYNQSVINKEGLALASQGCISLSGKMSTPGSSWFPWKTLSFLLLISTAAIINLDCQKHGSFSKSSTGQFLRDIGQYDRVIGGYQVVLDRTKEGRAWVDSNVPLYLEQAKKVGGPYYEVAAVKAGEAYDLVLVGYGKLEVAVKAGVVKLEGWVPGAQEQLNNVGLAICLSATPAALVHWHKVYTSHLQQSAQLLQYLDSNWGRFKRGLDVPEFHETIEAFEDYNQSVINKEGLALASQGCISLSGKMSTPGSSWFPWKTLSFLLLISTAAIINLDCQKHGNFSKSSTGQFLRDIGQYDRVIGGYQVMLDRTKEGRAWVDSNVPLYLEQAKKVGGPYYDVAAVKAGEAYDLVLVGYGKLEVAVKAGVVKLEGWVP